jgi:hypothetical protein
VRVDPKRHGDVVDLVVGKQPVALDLPGVEHLAAQRQHRLRLLVAAHLGTATGAVTLDQEDLIERDVAAFAVGQLARQHGDTGAPALLDLLRRALARLRLPDHEFGQLAAMLHMLAQPQLEGRFHVAGHQAQGVAAVQAFLHLALELRVEHLGREHEAGTREDIVRHQLDPLGQQGVQFDETLDGLEEAVLQARLVGAAGHGGIRLT